MSSVRKNRKAVKDRSGKKTAPREERPVEDKTDLRKQLYNRGQCGPIEKVQVPAEMITSLRGFLLDLDPKLFRPEAVPAKVQKDPENFYNKVLRPMLARHPVLNKAEVRGTGRGVHAVFHFQEPVVFETEADRQCWAAVVRVIQKLLPTDPDCPGITALTRAIGSTNSKNGARVRRLRKGEPVTAEEVFALFDQARTKPFRTVATILFGAERVTPCPVCKGANSRLDALDRVGQCYNGCGKVRLGQLFDVFLKPRPVKKEG